MHVDCGKGTYIRSLARDIGRELRTLGYLTALRRTRVGPWSVEQAVTLDEFERADDPTQFIVGPEGVLFDFFLI